MHSNTNKHPVGKCKGCPLNLKKRCAVFSHPKKQWAHGHCKGYMNEALYHHYLAEQMLAPQKNSKQIRKEKMNERKTIEHHDGILNPGGSRW
ncbi:MAG: hypothetical protein ISR85_05160 [Kiritimatiellales bacterium]|nr:hypothetical protein [Kiritimatiellota bacterium]MBL7012301.1 hypothetical protein [Kiritimatiellales bacterium]